MTDPTAMGFGPQDEEAYAQMLADLETAKAYREQDAYEASWDDAALTELHSLAPVSGNDTDLDRLSEAEAEERDRRWEERFVA